MPEFTLAGDIQQYAAQDACAPECTLRDANRYCRAISRRHYENFTVASWFLPRRLRQHFYNVYAYCRWADDLADESPSPSAALRLLDRWERELENCYRGNPGHPVFVALAPTIAEFKIPIDPFRDLLIAFRQDQRVTAYETHEDVLDYCRNSANPVGRLVLYLGRSHDTGRGELADSICTGLQLANFCQDVARDWDRGRRYLPAASMQQCGYDLEMFERREFNAAFRGLMQREIDRAESYLMAGRPLVGMIPRFLARDVSLFINGGLAILQAIRRIDYSVWSRRPTVGRLRKAVLLASALCAKGAKSEASA